MSILGVDPLYTRGVRASRSDGSVIDGTPTHVPPVVTALSDSITGEGAANVLPCHERGVIFTSCCV